MRSLYIFFFSLGDFVFIRFQLSLCAQQRWCCSTHVHETCRPSSASATSIIFPGSNPLASLLVYVQPKPITTSNPIFPSVHPQISLRLQTHPPIIIASVRVVAGLILLKGKEKSARVETSETDFRRCGRKMSGRPLSWMLHQRSKCPSCVRPSSGRSASSSTPPGINSLGSRR